MCVCVNKRVSIISVCILHYGKCSANRLWAQASWPDVRWRKKKYELWDVKFTGYMRLRKLSDTIDPRSDARRELAATDEANNADAFAELIQCLEDRSISLIMRGEIRWPKSSRHIT